VCRLKISTPPSPPRPLLRESETSAPGNLGDFPTTESEESHG
jgi:hypothetical protein